MTSAHWDDAYAQGEASRSWYQDEPAVSLAMFDSAGVTPAASVVDVGGGASRLADALLARGFADVTVLDVSATGIGFAQMRLGTASDRVHWVVTDVLDWQPSRRFDVWHDRAVFHFLTAPDHRARYLQNLENATAAGAVAVFGCFAADGPTQCSGLAVARYNASHLAEVVGPRWSMITQTREEHHTPGGAVQPFTWVALRRR